MADARAGRAFSWVSIVALMAVVASGCAMVLPNMPTGQASKAPDRPCTVAAIRSCALPYPSNEFAVADATTATGQRLEIPDGLIPDNVTRQLGPGATLADSFDGAAPRFPPRPCSTGETDKLVAAVRSAEHPIRNVQVSPPFLVQNASAMVTGEVAVSDFRDENGVVRLAKGATQRWVKFLMVLPERASGPKGAPVVIYGHGLTFAKETLLFTAPRNAAAGAATIAIDVPNHGDRQGSENHGWILDLTSPKKFGRVTSMLEQGILDNVSLLMAVEAHMGDLALTVPTWDGVGTPAPRLDTLTILYEDTSLGGVIGASFVALSPEIDGAFIHVAGSGIIDLIFHSWFWILFKDVVPSNATTGDAYALIGASTTLVDRADNSNLIQRVRDRGTPLFLAYGVGDGLVISATTDRMIALADLPLVGRQLTGIGVPFRSATSDAIPADGSGVAQIWPDRSVELRPLFAHLSFAQPEPVRMLDEWLAQRLAAEGAVG